MELTYEHLSYNDEITPMSYLQNDFFKPSGLWLSNGEWAAFSSYAGIGNYRHKHKVTLKKDNKLLWVKTARELLDLDEELRDPSFSWSDFPSWAPLVDKYYGVMIFPYQPSCRYDLLWYYIWDVAAGCIWNLDAIESTELVS